MMKRRDMKSSYPAVCNADLRTLTALLMVIRETSEKPWQLFATDYKMQIVSKYFFHVLIDIYSRGALQWWR